jgi:hypothetical protein
LKQLRESILEREQAEAVDVDRGIRETMRLEQARGHEFDEPVAKRGDTGRKPYRRKSGLDWLLFKGRISAIQMESALRYGDDWRSANDITVRSCLNDVRGGGDETTPQHIRMFAGNRLARARIDGLSEHKTLITLCDRVCGLGERVRDIANGDDEVTARYEAALCIALDLLAAHYGMVTTCETRDSSTLLATAGQP